MKSLDPWLRHKSLLARARDSEHKKNWVNRNYFREFDQGKIEWLMLKLTKVAKNIDEVDATSLLLELVAEPTKFFRRKSWCFNTEPAKPS